jgi:hypothetical protein
MPLSLLFVSAPVSGDTVAGCLNGNSSAGLSHHDQELPNIHAFYLFDTIISYLYQIIQRKLTNGAW